MNGILVVNKEKGYTSHDVVAILRRILKTKKIGHTGTLDPNAEGVLPICIGQATKISELLMNKDKVYRASFQLGLETDTQDIWGMLLRQASVLVEDSEVERICQSFVGDIWQIPPMFSALKQDGKKLYQLAREGKVVEREARAVKIHEISDFKALGEHRYTMTVHCSKGTYIRTLCHDIGKALGCGAVMTDLLRLNSGVFSLENALTLSEIEELQVANQLETKLLTIPQALPFSKLWVCEDFNKWLYAGNPIPREMILRRDEMSTDNYYLVFNAQNELIGIYQKKDAGYKVLKFLYQ